MSTPGLVIYRNSRPCVFTGPSIYLAGLPSSSSGQIPILCLANSVNVVYMLCSADGCSAAAIGSSSETYLVNVCFEFTVFCSETEDPCLFGLYLYYQCSCHLVCNPVFFSPINYHGSYFYFKGLSLLLTKLLVSLLRLSLSHLPFHFLLCSRF